MFKILDDYFVGARVKIIPPYRRGVRNFTGKILSINIEPPSAYSMMPYEYTAEVEWYPTKAINTVSLFSLEVLSNKQMFNNEEVCLNYCL